MSLKRQRCNGGWDIGHFSLMAAITLDKVTWINALYLFQNDVFSYVMQSMQSPVPHDRAQSLFLALGALVPPGVNF